MLGPQEQGQRDFLLEKGTLLVRLDKNDRALAELENREQLALHTQDELRAEADKLEQDKGRLWEQVHDMSARHAHLLDQHSLMQTQLADRDEDNKRLELTLEEVTQELAETKRARDQGLEDNSKLLAQQGELEAESSELTLRLEDMEGQLTLQAAEQAALQQQHIRVEQESSVLVAKLKEVVFTPTVQ